MSIAEMISSEEMTEEQLKSTIEVIQRACTESTSSANREDVEDAETRLVSAFLPAIKNYCSQPFTSCSSEIASRESIVIEHLLKEARKMDINSQDAKASTFLMRIIKLSRKYRDAGSVIPQLRAKTVAGTIERRKELKDMFDQSVDGVSVESNDSERQMNALVAKDAIDKVLSQCTLKTREMLVAYMECDGIRCEMTERHDGNERDMYRCLNAAFAEAREILGHDFF